MLHRRLILCYLSVMLLLLTFDIILIARIHFHVNDLTKTQLSNVSKLTLVIQIFNENLLEAAKDTWILECPFEVMVCLWCKNRARMDEDAIRYLTTTNRSISANQYVIAVDIRFYVIVGRLQKLLTEGDFHVYCSIMNRNKDCRSLLNIALIGPLQTDRDFYRMQARLNLSSRRRIQKAFGYDPSIDPQCVHNPLVQLETHPTFYLPECPSPPLPRITVELDELSAYVITLKKPRKDDAKKNNVQIASLITAFRSHGLHVFPFYGVDEIHLRKIDKRNGKKLTVGENALRITMHNFITQMIRTMVNLVLVFEDDVIPHKNFGSRLRKLLTTKSPDRCSAHLLDGPGGGGILLLGASVWSDQVTGWDMIDKDIKNHSGRSSCFNADLATYGAFAVLIHRTTFQPILNWLESPFFTHLPYDHVFKELSRQGHIVRVSYPFLAIADVSHVSSVNPNRGRHSRNINWRAGIHRWIPLSDYSLHTQKLSNTVTTVTQCTTSGLQNE